MNRRPEVRIEDASKSYLLKEDRTTVVVSLDNFALEGPAQLDIDKIGRTVIAAARTAR